MNNIAVTISNANKNVTPIESIHAVYDAGFKYVFIEWYNKDWEISQQEQLDECRKLGLNVIFAHLGYQGINNLWLNNEDGEKLVERYINDLRICKDNGINLVCMHLTSKSVAPKDGDIGIVRLRKIVSYAESIGMRIGFENTKIPGFLEYVLENIQSDSIGICLDSGHYHAHYHDELDFSLFKDKIFCVHLHDNNGVEDEHLIPFDGNIDWKQLLKHLKSCNYNGLITMELVYRNDYLKLNVVDFYKKGLSVGKQLEEMYNGNNL